MSMHAYTYKHITLHAHTCIQLCVCIDVYGCTHTFTHTVSTHMCMNRFACTQAHELGHVCTYVQPCMHTHTHTTMHMHEHAQFHVHICMQKHAFTCANLIVYANTQSQFCMHISTYGCAYISHKLCMCICT
jgi:hypothetical protein